MFGRRCIPSGGVARRSDTARMLPPRALPARRLDAPQRGNLFLRGPLGSFGFQPGVKREAKVCYAALRLAGRVEVLERGDGEP